MNASPILPMRRPILALALSLLAALTSASPGAHGPNGEHLDAKQAGTAAASAAPRLDAQSELFELVARLDGGELSILIDRFASNEPVLKATVEVQSGPLKARAKFHEDLGDYAVDDAALLKLLSTPGEHPLIITILAGDESDLLDGVLHVGAPSASDAGHAQDNIDHQEGRHAWPGHEHGIGWGRWVIGGFILLLLMIGWRWRGRSAGAAEARKANGDKA
jgi:hypothetical protein